MVSRWAAFDVDAGRELLEVLLAPVAWIPVLQERLVTFLLEGSAWLVATKLVLLALPLLLLATGLWTTMLGSYTVVVRPGRRRFLGALLVSWWDAARAAWLYWTGLARASLLVLGLGLGFVLVGGTLAHEALRSALVAPARAGRSLARRYLRPGLPWLALLLLIGWCLLESTVFTYLMFPSVTGWLVDRIGVEAPGATGPVLHSLLLALALGSFMGVEALRKGSTARDPWRLAGLVPPLLFVSFLEVGVLYRSLLDSVMSQVTGGAASGAEGPWSLPLAAGAWLGVRSLAWLFFGRAGAPALAALVSRRPLEPPAASPAEPAHATAARATEPRTEEIRRGAARLRRRAEDLIDTLTLAVMQVLAAALNLLSVLATARPAVDLPLRGVADVPATGALLARIRPSEEASGSGLPERPSP